MSSIIPIDQDVLMVVRHKATQSLYIVGRMTQVAGRAADKLMSEDIKAIPEEDRPDVWLVQYIRVNDKHPFVAFRNHFDEKKWEVVT